MKAKSMILIVIALVCGLVASIGVSQVMSRGNQGGPVIEERTVLVTSKDIDIGDKLNAENVRMEKFPVDRVPEGALSDIEEVEGQYAGARFYAGEFVVAKRLMAEAQTPVPDGSRVFPIRVSRDYVSNLVKPGDRVDISLFISQSGRGGSGKMVKTILTNVRIYSVNDKLNRGGEEDGNVAAVKSITVLVTHEQAERLSLAQEVGKLSLLLRSHSDTTEISSTSGVDIQELLGQGPDDADPDSTADRKNEGEFMDFLNQNGQQPGAPPVPVAPVAVHTMDIFTPDGVMRFEFSDEKELPKQVPVTGPAPQLPAGQAAIGGGNPSVISGLDGLSGLSNGAGQADGKASANDSGVALGDSSILPGNQN